MKDKVTQDKVRNTVRDFYANVAETVTGGCGCGQPAETTTCCAPTPTPSTVETSIKVGYSESELSSVPKGANMGLGCGNPAAIAALKPGETVLDLGSGGGLDCFLAANAVGPTGHVIGVDMTPVMISKSREYAQQHGFEHVEFRLGEIENLPVADNTVDVILSNCVINLSPDKPRVYQEAFRVLKSGGRLAISDVVATAAIPDADRDNPLLYVECVAGAEFIDDLFVILRGAGFVDITIKPKDESREFIKEWSPEKNLQDFVVSAIVEAVKPA